jgi:hypothetical protein
MTGLTDRERQFMLHTREITRQIPLPPLMASTAVEVADQLRRNLPDLSDVTLARVMIHVAGLVSNLATALETTPTGWDDLPVHVLITHLGVVFGVTAGDLASVDLDFT